MKFLILLFLLLVGCSETNKNGQTIKKPYEACVNGFVYYYSYGGMPSGSYMSPKFNTNEKLIECSMDVIK